MLHLFQDEVRGEPGWQGVLSDMQQDPHEWRCLGPPGPEKLAFPLGPRPQPRALRRWGVRLSQACWSQVPSAQPPQVTLSLSWVRVRGVGAQGVGARGLSTLLGGQEPEPALGATLRLLCYPDTYTHFVAQTQRPKL